MNGCRGRFYNAQDLLDELYASLADRSTPKLVRRICNCPVLLIDELGYLTFKPEHKTLNTPYDSGIVLCSDKEALTHALHASGSYIAYSENRDGMLYTPEMSRRARAIELWAALKYLGKEGVDELVFGLHQRELQIGQEL